MCKKPRMPPMPEMPLPQAPERQPERGAVYSAAQQNMRAQTGANRPAARILGNTSTAASPGLTNFGNGGRFLSLATRGITGAFSRGSSSSGGGAGILGG